MAQLAIRGHETRGKEVIEILEMLGGKNQNNVYSGKDTFHYYFIDNETGYIRTKLYTDDCWTKLTYNIFTLEEFFEKFPYKVGDRVISIIGETEVLSMEWVSDYNKVWYITSNGSYNVEYLQPYKEKSIDNTNKVIFEANAQCCDIMNHLIKEETTEEKLIPRIDFTGYSKNKYIIDLGDYDIKKENGKTYAVRKQPQYPKTYEECCKIVNASPYVKLVYNISDGHKYSYDEDNLQLYENIRRLKICRDAYWKIVGEKNKGNIDYVICNVGGKIIKTNIPNSAYNHIINFLTEEMRDAFYENFKSLIEECKELL